jgi:hypothetical protein
MTEGQARDATGASLPGPAEPAGAWQGDGLYARSSRFGLILLAPIAVAILGQGSQWLPYAILTCLLGFTADIGGPPLRRLTGFLIAGLVSRLSSAFRRSSATARSESAPCLPLSSCSCSSSAP